MRYLLDTNVVIAASLGIGDTLRERMAACDQDDLVTSAVAYAEVIYGSMRGKPPPLERLRDLLDEVPVLDFDIAAATTYSALPFKRGSYDQLIAAHALSRGLTVVTHNVARFEGMGLNVENWLA